MALRVTCCLESVYCLLEMQNGFCDIGIQYEKSNKLIAYAKLIARALTQFQRGLCGMERFFEPTQILGGD